MKYESTSGKLRISQNMCGGYMAAVVTCTFASSSKQKGKERPGDFWHELVSSSYKMYGKEI